MALLERVLNARTFYEVLGVTHTATFRDIEVAYLQCAEELLPSKSVNAICTYAYQRVCVAYGQLSDPVKRAAYNFDIGLMTLESTAAAAVKWKEETAAAAGAASDEVVVATAGGPSIPRRQQPKAPAAVCASTPTAKRPGSGSRASNNRESCPPAAVITPPHTRTSISMMDSDPSGTQRSRRREQLFGMGLVAAGAITVCVIRIMSLLSSRRHEFGSK
nr:DnaJ-like protein [Volvox reticuliferus]